MRWSLGMLSTQGPEHANKRMKKYIADNNHDDSDHRRAVIRHSRHQITCASKIVSKVQNARKLAYKCGVCGTVGHTMKSMLCPMHVDYVRLRNEQKQEYHDVLAVQGDVGKLHEMQEQERKVFAQFLASRKDAADSEPVDSLLTRLREHILFQSVLDEPPLGD